MIHKIHSHVTCKLITMTHIPNSNGNPRAAHMALNAIERYIKAMICKSQLSYFNGEGDDVGELLEDQLEKMEDYFSLSHSLEENKTMMGQDKLEKLAKLWWKDHR